jgi:hypothetical protein
MPASRTAALGLTLVLATGLAACGGDDGDDGGGGGGGSSETVSAEAYAGDVCGAMQDWITGIQERTQSLTESFQSGDPQEGKDALSDLLSEMSSQTGELITAVEDAGVPDVDGGEEAADSLVTAFEDVQGILDDAQQDIEDLPTDPQAFQQGAAELGPTLQEALSSVGSSLEEPESEELKEAFENEESCSSIP